MVKLIVAIDRNGAIGKGNELLYRIPGDLKNFKKLTTNNTVVMGRKTWESLPIKPLPNRKNIVLSSSTKEIKGATIINDFDELKIYIDNSNEDIFIIGGASIYDQALNLDLIDEVHITHILDETNDADAFFWMNKVRDKFSKYEKKDTFSQGGIVAEYVVYRK